MTEKIKVEKLHISENGQWYWSVPVLSYQAYRDGDGNEIKTQYATKSELISETNARIQAVSEEATARQNADNLKLDIPQFVFEGSEEGNECYIAKGTDDFVPPEGVIPIANIGNLTVTGSLNYDKMVTTNTAQTITGAKSFAGGLTMETNTVFKGAVDFDRNIGLLRHHHGDIVYGTTAGVWNSDIHYDSTGKELGRQALVVEPNGCNWYIRALKGANTTVTLGLVNSEEESYAYCPTPPKDGISTSITTKAFVSGTNPATKLNNLVHDVDNEDIRGIKKHLEGVYGVSQCINILATQSNRWIGISFKGNTTQFCKFEFCNFINSGTSVYVEGVMFWNGGSQNVSVKAYGYVAELANRMKWTVDGNNNFTVWMRGEAYHTIMANVYQSRSWTNTMVPEIVIIDNPNFSSYTKNGDVVIQ